MSTHDPFDFAADLPPPHDEEPASLRQDILDELADHLACSLRREAVLTPDEDQARHNVLKRFGNPAQVARKLWRDAMWEKIMTQRIVLATCGLAILLSFGVAAVVWQMAQQSQRSQAALLSQQQEFLSAFLSKMSEEKQDTGSKDGWSPLDVRVTNEDGQPVTQGTVQIQQENSSKEGDRIDMKVEVDSEGIARLGYFQWGKYELIVTLPELKLTTRRGVFLRPNSKLLEQFVCPRSVSRREMHFKFDPPDEMKDLPLLYCLWLPDGIVINNQQWWTGDGNAVPTPRFLFNSKGELLGRITAEKVTSVIPPGGVPAQNKEVLLLEFNEQPVAVINQPFSPIIVVYQWDSASSAVSVSGNGDRRITVPFQRNHFEEFSFREKVVPDEMGLCKINADNPVWSKVRAVADQLLKVPSSGQKTLTLKFLEDSPLKTPVAGVKIRPSGRAGVRQSPVLNETNVSDAKGELKLTFPYHIHPGEVSVELPWGAISSQITLNSTSAVTNPLNVLQILVPPQPATRDVTFQIDRPDEFKGSDFLFDIELIRKPTIVGRNRWWLPVMANASVSYSQSGIGDITVLPFNLLVAGNGQVKSWVAGRKAYAAAESGKNSLMFDIKLNATAELYDGDYELIDVSIVQERPELVPAFGNVVVERLATKTPPLDSSKFKAISGEDKLWQVELPENYWNLESKRMKLRDRSE